MDPLYGQMFFAAAVDYIDRLSILHCDYCCLNSFRPSKEKATTKGTTNEFEIGSQHLHLHPSELIIHQKNSENIIHCSKSGLII